MSVSIENYLKAVYQIGEDDNNKVTSSNLAKKLSITNAAITEMSRNLSKKGLIIYQKYKEIKLTEKGRQWALSVIRRHRLWELFLNKVLKMPWDEVHVEAEKLEHQTSETLINRLDEFLGFPQFDPHGDPIPDKSGVMPERKNDLFLTEATKGFYKIVRINANNQGLIKFFKTNNIEIDQIIELEENDSDMVSLRIQDSRTILNHEIASKIYVVKN
jgi:DtxR family Mn-dependent transcriptional regulator